MQHLQDLRVNGYYQAKSRKYWGIFEVKKLRQSRLVWGKLHQQRKFMHVQIGTEPGVRKGKHFLLACTTSRNSSTNYKHLVFRQMPSPVRGQQICVHLYHLQSVFYWRSFWTLLPNLTFYLIVQGFHRTYATGAVCQQRTLTPPDTWSCPFWDLLLFYLLRPATPYLD